MLDAFNIIIRTPFYPFTPLNLRESFEAQLSSKVFNEALFLSSPSLHEQFEKVGVLSEQTKLSLYKYFLRMTYRCTPFGMFSGISMGTVGSQTSFKLAERSLYRKHTRLDNHFINTFVNSVLKIDKIKYSINWYRNNTIYASGNSIRYVEYRLTNTQRTHHLAKVEFTTYLDCILQKARYGATIHELIATIRSDQITDEDAAAFIDELIESRLLLSELEPLVTGREPHKIVLDILEKHENADCYDLIRKLTEQLYVIESQPPGSDIDVYRKIRNEIIKWDSSYDPALIFQSDLWKPSIEMKLSSDVLRELQDAITFLALLNGRNENTSLKHFIEEFYKRYESSEVPLLEVLDSETGIGYPPGVHSNSDYAPLLQGLNFNSASSDPDYRVPRWQKKLMQLYQHCLAHGHTELTVSDGSFDIDKKKIDESILPDSMYTIFTILATSEGLESNDFNLEYRSSNGPSAVNLLGRFCHLNDDIRSIVDELVAREEQLSPNKIFAEVVHLAQARVGNVLVRPSLRKFEIPILTFSSVGIEHTINLDDIMVSVNNSRVVLRSKRLDKEILPRNSTAHNYSNNTLPYYHFLCDLQQQDNHSKLMWDWGLLNEFKFLPRVKYGRVILSKARWVIDEGDLKLTPQQTTVKLKEEIARYQIEFKLPRWVVLSQGDNQLPLDLDDDLCLKVLRQELVRNKSIVLEECLCDESNLVVAGPEGKFTNEVIVPWAKARKNSPVEDDILIRNSAIERNFLPGSSWHYIKIYCGVKVADKILTEVIKPLADELLEEKLISQWFFIRYGDPDNHLRIRFYGKCEYFGELTTRLNEGISPFLSQSLVWKIQNDTYKRELERYGCENIENAERIFFHDSVAVLEILKLLDGDEGDNLRWKFALKGVNDLLSDFGYSLPQKIKIVGWLRDGFAPEFNANSKDAKKQLSEHYRTHRKEVELILQPRVGDEHDYVALWQVFEKRSSNLMPIMKEMAFLSIDEVTSIRRDEIIGSYLHMFINRFMRSRQRLHEFVIYDFLCQHYNSIRSRQHADSI